MMVMMMMIHSIVVHVNHGETDDTLRFRDTEGALVFSLQSIDGLGI